MWCVYCFTTVSLRVYDISLAITVLIKFYLLAHTHTRARAHTYTHTHTYKFTHAYILTHIYKYTHTYTITHTHTRARARTHTHAHNHRYTHKHTHKHKFAKIIYNYHVIAGECSVSSTGQEEFDCYEVNRCISNAVTCDDVNNCGDWTDESIKLCGLCM